MELIQASFEYFLVTFVALFVIVNPLTTSFVFLSLTPKDSFDKKQEMAKRAFMVSTALFIVFAFLGGLIFKLFGITLEAFRIAGGIILLGIAMNMVRKAEEESDDLDADEAKELIAKSKKGEGISKDISVVPLAIPFISGPGSIATVMILTSEAPSFWHLIIVIISILITTSACYYAMINSHHIVKYIGPIGREIITRIFGIILCVIAVQFMINGITDIYISL